VHIGVKLPDIAYGLKAKVADADVVTEIPWNENPYSHSNAGTLPAPPAWHLAAGCWAAAGAGIGVVVVTSVSQTLPPLEPIGLLAPRQWTKGPQGSPSTAPPIRRRSFQPPGRRVETASTGAAAVRACAG
jgi:hypothetical protein